MTILVKTTPGLPSLVEVVVDRTGDSDGILIEVNERVEITGLSLFLGVIDEL